MTIHELIARFRDIHAKATPGPWEETYGAQRDPVCVFPIAGAKGNEPKEFFIHGANGKHGRTDQETDAALIIAMHTRLPEILDVLEGKLADLAKAVADLARTTHQRDEWKRLAQLNIANLDDVMRERDALAAQLAAIKGDTAAAIGFLSVTKDRLIRMGASTAVSGSHARVALALLAEALAVLAPSPTRCPNCGVGAGDRHLDGCAAKGGAK